LEDKENSGGKYTRVDQIYTDVRNWLQMCPPSFYDAGVKKLPTRWQKCIEKGGNYVEK